MLQSPSLQDTPRAFQLSPQNKSKRLRSCACKTAPVGGLTSRLLPASDWSRAKIRRDAFPFVLAEKAGKGRTSGRPLLRLLLRKAMEMRRSGERYWKDNGIDLRGEGTGVGNIGVSRRKKFLGVLRPLSSRLAPPSQFPRSDEAAKEGWPSTVV